MAIDTLSTVFSALAHPARRAIIARLASGEEATVTELAKPFSMSTRAVSKHLRVLEDAGLITSGRDAQRRPRRLDASQLKSAAAWFEQYHHFWDASLGRLEQYVRTVQQAKSQAKGKPRQKKEKRDATP